MNSFKPGKKPLKAAFAMLTEPQPMTTDPHLEADLAWLESLRPHDFYFDRVAANARIDRLIARAGSGQPQRSMAAQIGADGDLPSPASPVGGDGADGLIKAWEAVNVLGAPDSACITDEELTYCRAIGDALHAIEGLAGFHRD